MLRGVDVADASTLLAVARAAMTLPSVVRERLMLAPCSGAVKTEQGLSDALDASPR